MATRPPLLSEDQLLCPICLGVFVQPVSTPCGHNFCMSCLSSYWDRSPVSVCPVCKERYSQRPQLRVNTFISGLSQSFSSLQLSPGASDPQGSVWCDVCTAPQQEALKSCVECLSSLCSVHLEPHLRVPGLRRHTLIHPDAALQSRVCPEHQQLRRSFCNKEKVLLCPGCENSHSNHRIQPLEGAHRELRSKLGVTEAKVTSLIEEGIQTISFIQEAAAQRQEESSHVITLSESVLQELLSKVQRSHNGLVQKLEEKQEQADSAAETVAEELQLNIIDLRGTRTKVQEMKRSEDPLLFLLNFPNMSVLQRRRTHSSLNLKEEELKELSESLQICTARLQGFLLKLNREISLFSDEKWCALRRAQRHAVDLKFDPETAHPDLHVSRDQKQVWYNPKATRAPGSDNSRRFLASYGVVTDRGFSSGKFYFEVSVGQKDEWILGVMEASVPRAGVIPRSPDSGVWAVYFRVDNICKNDDRKVPVHRGRVESVGVFVDRDKGLVSVFDLKTAACVHSFTQCAFTDKLYPVFNPCDDEFPSNASPMILLPVAQD